jgi:hypothetical protein
VERELGGEAMSDITNHDGGNYPCSTFSMPSLEDVAEKQQAQRNQLGGIQGSATGSAIKGYVPAATVLSEAQILALRIMAGRPSGNSLEAQMMSGEMRAMYERCAAIIAKI